MHYSTVGTVFKVLLLSTAVCCTSVARLLAAGSSGDVPFQYSGISWGATYTVDGTSYAPRCAPGADLGCTAAAVDAATGQLYVLAVPYQASKPTTYMVLRYDPANGTLLSAWPTGTASCPRGMNAPVAYDLGPCSVSTSLAVSGGLLYVAAVNNGTCSIQVHSARNGTLLGSWAVDTAGLGLQLNASNETTGLLLAMDEPELELVVLVSNLGAKALLRYALGAARSPGKAPPLLWRVPPAAFGGDGNPSYAALAVDEEGTAFVSIGPRIFVVPAEGLLPGEQAGWLGEPCPPQACTCPVGTLTDVVSLAATAGWLLVGNQDPVCANGGTWYSMLVYEGSVNGTYQGYLEGPVPAASGQPFDGPFGTGFSVATAPSAAAGPVFVLPKNEMVWYCYDLAAL